MRLIIWVSSLLVMQTVTSAAETISCTTSVAGQTKRLSYRSDDDMVYGSMTFRDAISSGWNNSCPALVTLRLLTPELSDWQRKPFCLSFDKDRETYIGFEQGKRDAYGTCKAPSKTTCERVNATKDTLLAVSGLAAGASGGAATTASAAGVTAVAHSSGAVILTGSSGYIAGTLGTAGATALGILTAPATITGTVLSLVLVGGAVYVCQD